jgi:hypothetical protein
MLWTERLFQLIPIGKESGSFASFLKVRLIRSLCFAFVIGLIGLPFFWGAGFNTNTFYVAVSILVAMLYFVIEIFLVLVVSGWFHNKWDWFFDWSSHILRLSETEFDKFRDRMEKVINSFYACIGIAAIFIVIGMIPSMRIIIEMLAPFTLRPMVMIVFLVFTNSFMMLLFGTLIWMILSMWITFYTTLRRPLNLRLSPHTDEEFRPLAVWSLKVLFITFMLIPIFAVFKEIGVLVVPGGFAGAMGVLIFYIILGVLAFLLPFYHIHRVLMKLKKQELLEIEKEHDKLVQDLAKTSSTNQASDTEEHMMLSKMVSLQILEIRERRAKEADVWPIDMTILSAVAGLVIIPILVNIITNLI